jgi:hypothetical protein
VTTNDERIEQARRRGKRYALGVFVVLATAFVVSSTWQIMAGVFGIADARAGESPNAAPCVAAIHDLETALDRARTQSAAAHDEDEAARAFNAALDPALDAALDARCARNEDFHAAALRLRSASEVAVRRLAREVGRVQSDVDRLLPAQPRGVSGQ